METEEENLLLFVVSVQKVKRILNTIPIPENQITQAVEEEEGAFCSDLFFYFKLMIKIWISSYTVNSN